MERVRQHLHFTRRFGHTLALIEQVLTTPQHVLREHWRGSSSSGSKEPFTPFLPKQGSVTNQVSVSGGGSATAVVGDLTTIVVPAYLISTLAGRALPPTALPGTRASIGRATAVATDAMGNTYIASESNVVYKLDSKGTLTRVVGNLLAGFSGDNGPTVTAQLNQPTGVAVDGAGHLYIADSANARIRMVGPDGTIVTVAGNGTEGFQWGWRSGYKRAAAYSVRHRGGCVRQLLHR